MSLEKRLPSQNTQHRTTQYFTELSNKFLEKKGGGDGETLKPYFN